MALILRNGGSQSPDRWLKEPRNNHRGTIPRRKKKFASILCIPERFFDVIYSKELCELEKCKEKFYDYYGETGILKMRKLASKQIKNYY